ncbi:MAG: STAS domain-containing protein [Spongiibacteraceae bacterium]
MTAEASLSFAGDCMQVAGEINFTSVIALETEGAVWLQSQAPDKCRVNLGAVSYSNSAGAALLISWQRTAAAVGKKLEIEQVPQSLQGLLHLSGLDNVLPALI